MNEILLARKAELKQIAELIIDKQDVVYFDYPLHLNVGDLLIYAGTEQFFKDYDIRIRLRRSLQAFDIDEAKKYITPNTTILCHGGGNFGDLYPSIQKMREDIARKIGLFCYRKQHISRMKRLCYVLQKFSQRIQICICLPVILKPSI